MKTTKFLLLIIPILLLSFKSEKRTWKSILPFEQLVYQSELIVNGEISKVDEKVYQFEITKLIKGNHKICDEIKVEKWHEWACDRRGIEHKVGQQIILFLKKEDYNKESWKIINGSTGEKILKFDKYWKFHKSKIFHSVNLVEKYFEKINDWQSKINCSTLKLATYRIENGFFNRVVSEMERQERIEI